MNKCYTYRIYPTDEQQQALCRIFGCHRYVFNKSLEYRISEYVKGNKVSYSDMLKWTTSLRGEYQWLADCPSQVLQMSIRKMDSVYSRFIKGEKLPPFLSKYGGQSVKFPQGVQISFRKSLIKLPKIGELKCIYDRKLSGKITMVTVHLTCAGDYFIKVLVKYKDIAIQRPVSEHSTIGVSVGINTLYALSNGTRVSKPMYITDSENKLKRGQRALIRKVKGSAGWKEQNIKLFNVEQKLSNQKRDYLHKVSNKLVQEFDTIVVEDNQSHLMDMLSYKCAWYGNNLIKTGICKPCSDICVSCGSIRTLKDVEVSWKCSCGHVHNTNNNKALIIKSIGLRGQPLSANTE